MASIKKRTGKNGVSYQITVSAGYDSTGRKMIHTKTWAPEKGMTPRQTEKALQRAAADFERSIELGFQLDNRQTFAEYAGYVLGLKEQEGCKVRTLDRYKELLVRINQAIGHLKLVDIRPQHLNAFYKNLGENGLRKGNGKATAKPALLEKVKQQGIKRPDLAQAAGVGTSTINAIMRGEKVRQEKAQAVAQALGAPLSELFKVEANTAPLSAKTVLEHHRLISTILAQAEKEMLVPYNAAEKATPPKVARAEPNYFQPAEIRAILDALDTEPLKWRTIVNLMIVTGCRRGEIMGLRWDRVSFDLNRIKIDRALLYTKSRGVYEDSTKTGDVRYLRLPAETMQLLREWKQEQEHNRLMCANLWTNSGYVFTQDDGQRMNPDSITAWLRGFSERHGLPHINPHAFRHTVASVLISNGTDVVTVSKQLGHASVTTTEGFYAHMIEEQKAKATECIADVLLRSGRRSGPDLNAIKQA